MYFCTEKCMCIFHGSVKEWVYNLCGRYKIRGHKLEKEKQIYIQKPYYDGNL